jgi:hypothetical protein
VGIEELRQCSQKQKESMRSYIRRFTKLLNVAKYVSIDRAIDAFSDSIRRESYVEELGHLKPKTITKLMEIANSWADGEDHVRKPRPRNDDNEDDRRHPNDSSNRRDRGNKRRKKRRDRGYDAANDTNMVVAGYTDRHDDRRNDRRDDHRDNRRDDNCGGSGGSRGNWQPCPARVADLPVAEQLNTPCYMHSYIDPKDGVKKSTQLLKDCRQFLDLQKFYEALNPCANVQAYPMVQGAPAPNPPPAPQLQIH